MNPLLMLLGQQAGVGAADPNIDVIASRQKAYSPEDGENVGTRLLGNAGAVEAAQQANAKAQEVSERKGMFGLKGTLRDVIGLLGDAFLVQGGGSAIYAPTRRQEQLSDAAAGFTDDPLAAAERVTQVPGGVELGRKLYDDYTSTELKRTQAQSLAADRSDKAAVRQAGLIADGRKVAQGVLAQSGAYDSEGNISPAAMAVLDRIAKQSNATLDDLIGENMTGEEARLYGGAGINPYQQAQLPLQERRVATGERNAATAEGRLQVSRRQAEIAAQQLGLRRDTEEFNQFMDYYSIGRDTVEDQQEAKKSTRGPRTLPNAKKLSIRPVQ